MKKTFILISLIFCLSSCSVTHDYYMEREIQDSSTVSMKEWPYKKHFVSTFHAYLLNYFFLPAKMIDQTIATMSGVNPIYSKNSDDFQFSFFVLPFAWVIDTVETIFGGANYGFLVDL